MILLYALAAVIAVFGVVLLVMEGDEEESIRLGYLRENEDPESYNGSDLHEGYPS